MNYLKKFQIVLFVCLITACSDSILNPSDNNKNECKWTDEAGNENNDTCTDSQTCCQLAGCVDLTQDNNNCGKCLHACHETQICKDSICEENNSDNNGENNSNKPDETDDTIICATGLELCDGECFDLATSKEHCGSCDTSCPDDRYCYNSTCYCEDNAQTLCDDICLNLSESHRLTCTTCQSKFGNCDENWDNGCETSFNELHLAECGLCEDGYGDCDGDITNGCELKLSDSNRSACNTCADGYGNCDDDWSNGCELNLMNSKENCGTCSNDCGEDAVCIGGTCTVSCSDGKFECKVDGQPHCIDDFSNNVEHCGSCNYNCNQLPNVKSTLCQNGECVITACDNGLANCDQNSSNGCETNPATDAKHCGASGLCDNSKNNSAGLECPYGNICDNAICRPVPNLIGCSDGSREGFINVRDYQLIAACGGAWTIKGIHHNAPSCDRASGNNGTNSKGNGCNVEDLCAEGWHVCLGRDDVKSRTTLGCSGIMDGLPEEPAFFITRTSSTGSLNCAPDTAGTDNNMNDVFGCGNFGCSVTASACTPLELSSHNLCDAFKNTTCGCVKNSDGTVTCPKICTGNGITFNGNAHPLQYFNLLNNKTYPVAWTCNGDASGWSEARDILKTNPEQQGGVLCCKDQCQVDTDCTGEQVCSFHVCVDKPF